jgi:MEDS: MEthanogen/methylotroph, DcmR Sensory domain
MLPHRPTCRHSVLFYKDDASVRESVSGYIASALRAGEPALVIARPALLHELTIEVHRQHVQGAPFGPERGAFITLDAEATLARICVEGKPDARLFQQVVGGVLDELCDSGKRVAAYGEMVGLLCERGHYADAVRLEHMWNALLARCHASLFCGYASELFRSPASRAFYEEIRATHSHVEVGSVAAFA